MGNDCRDILGQLNDYLDGQAGRELCRRLERHLESCPECRVVVDTTRKTVKLYRHGYTPRIPPAFEFKLHDLLRSNWNACHAR